MIRKTDSPKNQDFVKSSFRKMKCVEINPIQWKHLIWKIKSIYEFEFFFNINVKRHLVNISFEFVYCYCFWSPIRIIIQCSNPYIDFNRFQIDAFYWPEAIENSTKSFSAQSVSLKTHLEVFASVGYLDSSLNQFSKGFVWDRL